jgi:hypothetical protein
MSQILCEKRLIASVSFRGATTMHLAYDPKDVHEMTLVREYLCDERNHAITHKDWERVTAFKRRIYWCDNRIASLRFHQGSN